MHFAVVVHSSEHNDGGFVPNPESYTDALLAIVPSVTIGESFKDCLPQYVSKCGHVFSVNGYSVISVRIMDEVTTSSDGYPLANPIPSPDLQGVADQIAKILSNF